MQTFKLLARRTLPTSQAVLPVLAFAASAALFLLIAGGIHAFYTWLGGDASTATSVEAGSGTKNTAHTAASHNHAPAPYKPARRTFWMRGLLGKGA